MNPNEWLKTKGIDPAVAWEAGIEWDGKRLALKYPRISTEGVLVGHKIRELLTDKQYNYPKGIGHKDTLPFTAKHGDDILAICEGETDALALASWLKLNNDFEIVGAPGASSWMNEWAGLYKDYATVFVFPDPDEAGAKFAEKVCSTLPRARVVRLPKDVSDCVVSGMDLALLMSQARHLPVKNRKLRRSSYEFKPSVRVSPGVLLELVQRDVKLKRRGQEYVGLCPFHEERTPSFMVNPDKGLFYCQGCMSGGDAVTYVMKRRGIPYREAKHIVGS